MNKLYRQYNSRAAFYIVYIQEAHPTDAWQMVSNVRDNVLFASPKSAGERDQVAGACVRRLGIEIPALVDNLDDAVERVYTGWPDRLYVIDADGRIAWKSAPGPFGFHPAGVETALNRILYKSTL